MESANHKIGDNAFKSLSPNTLLSESLSAEATQILKHVRTISNQKPQDLTQKIDLYLSKLISGTATAETAKLNTQAILRRLSEGLKGMSKEEHELRQYIQKIKEHNQKLMES